VPQTISELAFATVVLVVVGALCYLALWRWGPGDKQPDPLGVLWRKVLIVDPAKVLASRKAAPPVPVASPEEATPEPSPVAEIDEPRPPRVSEAVERLKATSKLWTRQTHAVTDQDHMPLADPKTDLEERPDEKAPLRQRFRRGLRKTRDYLNRDVRDVFGVGPTPEAFDRLEEILVGADVGVATATALTDHLRAQEGLTQETLPDALRDAMVDQLANADRRLRLIRGRLSIWVVVGVNGTGKTTTIAKLGARAKSLGLNVSLAAADTFRAAAVEQLAEWGRRLDLDVVQQGQGADPGAVVFDAIAHARAQGYNLLIVDTAGRLHTKKPLMDELQKVMRVIERDDDAALAECLLVIDATTGQNGITQARAFKDAANVTGLVLAKLDGTAKGGIAFAVERELAVPVKAVGVGESEKDLIPFEPRAFVEALVGPDEAGVETPS
jgi:fused signal recognition particle receptor